MTADNWEDGWLEAAYEERTHIDDLYEAYEYEEDFYDLDGEEEDD